MTAAATARKQDLPRTLDYSPDRIDELAEQLRDGMLLYAPPKPSAIVRDFVYARHLPTTPDFARLVELLAARGLRLEHDVAFFWNVIRAVRR